MVNDDYMSYAPQILMKKAIYISLAYQDMRLEDIKWFRTIARPWIQRTIGILTKHEVDQSKLSLRKIMKEILLLLKKFLQIYQIVSQESGLVF